MMKTTQTKIKTYSKQCLICKQEITGYSESQVDYNMSLHHDKHKREVYKQK